MHRSALAVGLALAASVQCAPVGMAPRSAGLGPPEAREAPASPPDGGAPADAATALAELPPPDAGVPAPDEPSYLENADHLERFFRTLAALEGGGPEDHVRILQFGDSHTASDLGVSVFRKTLQARFGDGGRGFVPIGKPWKGFWRRDLRVGNSREFVPSKAKATAPIPNPNGVFGLAGVRMDALAPGANAWTDVGVSFSRLDVDYWKQPGGGSVDLLVDHVRVAQVASRSPTAKSGYFHLDVADSPHSVEVRVRGDGPVRIFGMDLERAQRGVVVDTLGIVGAQIFTPLRWVASHFDEQVGWRKPDLVILAYGTNEAVETELTDAHYERGLTELVKRVGHAAPNASCLLLGPPDLARWNDETEEWATSARLLEIMALQRRVASALGCAYYDQFAAMGGKGSISAWAAEPEPRALRDHVHLTKTGYADVATHFATDLLRAYDAWRKTEATPEDGGTPENGNLAEPTAPPNGARDP